MSRLTSNLIDTDPEAMQVGKGASGLWEGLERGLVLPRLRAA